MTQSLSWASLRPLLDALGDAVYVVDRERRILYWNPAAEQLTGYSAQQLLGTACFDNLLQHVDEHDTPLCTQGCPLHATLCDCRARGAALYLQHQAGHRVPVAAQIVPLLDEQGQLVAAAEVFRPISVGNISTRELAEARRLAFEDTLTGLPNRRYAEQELVSRLYELQTRGQPLAMLMLDLDRFKRINDVYGHQAGDAALRVVGSTLAAGVRAPDVVARWGGDEFVVLLTDMSETGVQTVAERLRILIRRSRFAVPSGRQRITVSVGATVAAISDTPLSLVERGDQLMYASKRAGGDRITFSGLAARPSTLRPAAATDSPTLRSEGRQEARK